MKSGIRIAALFAAMLCLLSCSKEGTDIFKGNYSFKTSGNVGVEATFTSGEESSERSFDMQLATEQGQMDIISRSETEVLITMNVLGGDVYTAQAKVQDEVLVLEPYTRYVRLEFPDFGHKNMPVTISGTAERYGDSIIFTLAYSGEYDWEDEDRKLHAEINSSDVRTVARLN